MKHARKPMVAILGFAAAICASADASNLIAAEPVAFVQKPSATAAGKGAKIAFELSAPTDIEVAVLSADGKVVRHLAAGVLGGKSPPPEPLKAGLAQECSGTARTTSASRRSGGPSRRGSVPG